MKLWLLSQDDNTGYDTYDSCIVAADTADAAKQFHPNELAMWSYDENKWLYINILQEYINYSWAYNINNIDAMYICETNEDIEAGVILASFNAG